MYDKGKPINQNVILPNGNCEVSTFGYHYWNSKVVPDMETIFWPPLIDKPKNKTVSPIKFKVQTDRTPILKMTNDVNQNRFEFIDKKVEIVSNQHRPPKYEFGTLIPRSSKANLTGPNNSF